MPFFSFRKKRKKYFTLVMYFSYILMIVTENCLKALSLRIPRILAELLCSLTCMYFHNNMTKVAKYVIRNEQKLNTAIQYLIKTLIHILIETSVLINFIYNINFLNVLISYF